MKLSEVYNSVQGEGPKVGLPTTFVRFALCNLRCAGWPCDTPHAIYPKEYRNEWETISVDSLTERIVEKSYPGANICLTGGEPWLQGNGELRELTAILFGSDRNIECFTNGSIMIPDWAFDGRMSFVIDCKLEGSGETERSINPEIFRTNLHRAVKSGVGSLKFTVASHEDMAEAMERYDEFTELFGFKEPIPVYVGVVWDKVKEAELVEWMLECELWHWKMNIQTHKHIWPADARGV